MKRVTAQFNRKIARQWWGQISPIALRGLNELTNEHLLSIASGDLLLLGGRWYVTHKGLLRLAHRSRCAGIHVRPMPILSDPSAHRWVFEATVYRSRACRGFVGHGDADPSNVSPLVHGAEMRIAETRAVNRALRKAYGVGLCSVEELEFQYPTQPGVQGVHETPAPAVLRQWAGRANGPRPTLPGHPSTYARPKSRKGLRRRFLRRQNPQRRYPGTS